MRILLLVLLTCYGATFALADPTDDLFQRALDQYYNGHRDEKTLELLRSH